MDHKIKTILIVDDNRLPRIIERAILSEHFPELSVLEAATGEEALETARKQPVDLALVDINVPGMDGLELGEWLRKESLVTHICFVSANIQNTSREKAAQLNAQFIAKPMTEEKLITLIEGIGVA
ncbi:MAG: response regulator [Gammaproteobacteria bacterium]|nr:response regulator [Gammaproteobacteria bacterium]